MLLSLGPILLIAWLAVRRFSRTPAEAIAHSYLVAFGVIVVCGQAASAAHRIRDPLVWLGASLLLLGAAVFVCGWRRPDASPRADRGSGPGKSRERALLVPMAAAVIATGVLNALVLAGTAPNAIDGLDYHLARIGYYLQQNSFAYYEANFWAQVVQPLNATLVATHAYLASGGSERLASIWQYISYWTAMAAVFGTTEIITADRFRAWFAALLFGLLTQSLMQANTSGDDMILAAQAAVAVMSLLAYERDGRPHHLVFAAAASALGLGTKSSFAVPAVLIGFIAAAVIARARQPIAALAVAMVAGAAALALFVAPAGYLDTQRRFGRPLGPSAVFERHTFAGRDAGYVAAEGTKNILRFGADFLSLDGLPRIGVVNAIQQRMRSAVRVVTLGAGVDLEAPGDIRAPFQYDRIASAHEAHSYWGVLGFLLVWPSVFAALVRRDRPVESWMAISAVGFLVLQAFSGPYDPWRGRYFLIAGAFAAPLASRWMRSTGAARAYVLLVVWIGCGSALTAVVLRSNRPLLTTHYDGRTRPGVFSLDRASQMMTNASTYETALREYERRVPAGATVAVALPSESPEYVLFGAGLVRTLRPINWFHGGLQPAPGDARFLLYAAEVIQPDPRDAALGGDWYLRVLY